MKNLPAVEDDDHNSDDDEENDFTILRRQRFDGHGQEAVDDDDDLYTDAEPSGWATPVTRQRARDPQVPPNPVPTAQNRRSQVAVTPPRVRSSQAVPNDPPRCVAPPRT